MPQFTSQRRTQCLSLRSENIYVGEIGKVNRLAVLTSLHLFANGRVVAVFEDFSKIAHVEPVPVVNLIRLAGSGESGDAAVR
jgi:hypothetical protein